MNISTPMNIEEDSVSTKKGLTDRKKKSIKILTLIVILFILIFSLCTFTISPGEVGVVITLGNAVAYDPGFYFRAPFFSRLVIMNAKTQLLNQNNLIPTKEGLAVTLGM